MNKKPLVVEFTKMDGAGNDFVVLDNRFYRFSDDELAALARDFCPRRTGIGADGLLALSPPAEAAHHYRMRYFNPDGSRAGLCGNGARCLARFAARAGLGDPDDGGARTLVFTSDAGTYRATTGAADDAPVRLFVRPPSGFRPETALQTDGLAGALLGPVAFVWTGTEHAVLFVDDAEEAPVASWGAAIRRDAAFAPEGANANFVEVREEGSEQAPALLEARTFEKGVEAETLACGTGALAAAVVAWQTSRVHPASGAAMPIGVQMPGGRLRVGFRAEGEEIADLYLEGPAETVFRGTLEVYL